MMTDKHTPTPWVALEPNQFGDVTITQDGESAELVAVVNVDIMRMFNKQEEFTANTAFIVKAANAHHALEAFRMAVIGWRECDWPEGFDRRTAQMIADKAEERAIALAKGTEQ